MVRHVTSLQLDIELYNRLADLRGAVSLELRFHERSLGVAPMLGLLVDHWQAHPPTAEWLKERAALYPKRGRPPKHAKGTPVTEKSDVRVRLGHELVRRRADEGRPHHTWICKNCNMNWSTWDFPTPPARCPADGKTVSIFTPKRWKKSELLALNFEPDEVGWADDDEASNGIP